MKPQTGPAGDMPSEEETAFTDYRKVDGHGGLQRGDPQWRGGRHHADRYEREVKLRPEDSLNQAKGISGLFDFAGKVALM